MKINGTGGIDPIKAYTAQLKKAGVKDKTGGQSRGDTFEISPEAMKIQTYRDKLAEIPATREDLVASLKQKVQEGTYKPDGSSIAEGIIRERLLDKHV